VAGHPASLIRRILRARRRLPCPEAAGAQLKRGAPPPAPEAMLAAYRAHLARRMRHFGPLTPVDLRI
jgi:hypothetical protein